MSERFEEAIVAHCAATLAGHKCGSLFYYKTSPEEACADFAAQADALLAAKGTRVTALKSCANGGLVYVYRPAMLEKRLGRPNIMEFLRENGYGNLSIPKCLAVLAGRVGCGCEFPHEIGVFLDYPLSDVKAFIENGGRGCKCVGCWKAYTNEAEAERRFALYRKCRFVYLNCYRRGFGVLRLTVAA